MFRNGVKVRSVNLHQYKFISFHVRKEDDNVRHLVMECPSLQTERTRMFNELRNECGGCATILLDNHNHILVLYNWLIWRVLNLALMGIRQKTPN